ncbi:MAG: AAA family ATPase [Spirochaetia bacterium]|jgi:exodeoxyribonuclease V alpha subunit
MSPEEELRALGLSEAQAVWMRRRYRDKALAVAREDPYRLAHEVPGVGFKTADDIATRLGSAADSPERIRAGIVHCLRERAEEGDVCLPFHRLVQEAQALLQADRRVVSASLRAMDGEGQLVIESPPDGAQRDSSVYLPAFRAAEAGAAEGLLRISRAGAAHREINEGTEIGVGAKPDIDAEIARAQAALGIALAPGQVEGLRAALSRGLTVITGGPGTGKTTVLKCLLAVCERRRLRVELAAPTGRAARRMSEATGGQAKTIHRMLEFAPGPLGFRKNRSDPLACDLCVVDEASMVDTLLMHHLLQALPPRCALLLVGDADQLPSVGAGQVLRDIVASGSAAVVQLTDAFRQAQQSDIVAAAHRILQGLLPEEQRSRGQGEFLLIEEEDAARAVRTVVELVRERIPRRLSVDPVDGIQVLAPMHKGAAGSTALNDALQAALNPGGAPLTHPDRKSGPSARTLRIGDKVMQKRNNYDKGVFNGDVGKITGVSRNEGSVAVSFDGEEVLYDPDELDQLSLAYALSVHKSQGSEYPSVVLTLLGEHAAMLQRNLLYTAVTRARRLVVIVGSRAALQTAVRRTDSRGRCTGLAERLRAGAAFR